MSQILRQMFGRAYINSSQYDRKLFFSLCEVYTPSHDILQCDTYSLAEKFLLLITGPEKKLSNSIKLLYYFLFLEYSEIMTREQKNAPLDPWGGLEELI